MVAVALAWIAEAVAGELAGLGLRKLDRGWRRRLAHNVSKHVPGVSIHRVSRFLKSPQVFGLLASGNPQDVVTLRRLLENALVSRLAPPRTEQDRELLTARADRALNVLLREFLAALDPSRAVSVASERQLSLLATIDRKQDEAIQLHHQTLRVLVREDSFNDLLLQVPAGVDETLGEYSRIDQAHAAELLSLIIAARDAPQEGFDRLITSPPEWLTRDKSMAAWEALGESAAAYDLHTAAAKAFEQASLLGERQATALGRAALEMLNAGDPDAADALAVRALAAGGTAFLDVLQAIRGDDWVALEVAANRLIDDNEARTLGLAFKASSLLLQHEWDRAVQAGEEFLKERPRATGSRIVVARALLARIESGVSRDRTSDWRRALGLLVESRDIRRQWNGPSAEAVEWACKAAIVGRDWALCMKLGLGPPRGDATPDESNSPHVLPSVIAAAIVADDNALAESLIPLLDDPFESAHQRSLLAEHEDRPREEVRELQMQALDAASSLEQLYAALMGLASLGEWPLPRLAEIEALSLEKVELLTAMSESERGLYEQATIRLRPYAATSAKAAELLARTQSLALDTNAAVATLRDAFRRFQDSSLLVYAIRLLLRDGRSDDAEREVAQAIAAVSEDAPSYPAIRRLSIQVALDCRDWSAAAARARAYLASLEGDDAQVLWALVTSLGNQALLRDASRVLDDHPELPITSTEEATTWLVLQRELPPSDERLNRSLDLAAEYAENEDVMGTALLVALEMSSHVQVGHETAERAQGLIDLFVDRYPESTILRRYDFSSPEVLLEQLRGVLEPSAALYNVNARRVSESGYPAGILSLMSGRSYTEALVSRAAGAMVISSALDAVRAHELDVATDSLERPVALDLSALNTISLLPDFWQVVSARFSGFVLHIDASLDSQSGARNLAMKSTRSLGWDSTAGRPVMHELDAATAEELARRAAWIAEKATAIRAIGDKRLTTFPLLDGERFGSWLGAIEVAKQEGIALYADDVGLRTLAEEAGVGAFGTLSLMESLVSRGAITSQTLNNARLTLLRNFAVDVAYEKDLLVATAESDGWAVGASTFQLTRPIFWRDQESAFRAFHRLIVGNLASAAPTPSLWTEAALRGLAHSASSIEDWRQLGGAACLFTTWATGYDAQVFSQLMTSALGIEAEQGRSGLLESVVGALAADLSESLDPRLAVSEVQRLVAGLPEEVRFRALRRLLVG